MAEYFVGPVIEKLINACFEYLKDQVGWKADVEEELKKLQNILPQIQAVVSVYSQAEIKDPALNQWYWQLRDVIDEVDDVLDEIEYRKLQKHASKIDSYLKKLKEAVHKLHEISARVSTFLHILDSAKQEQFELHKKRETGPVIKNVLLGRIKEMEFITQWLRDPYEAQSADTVDMYKNISLLCVVGHGGMGKTTLLQHAYNEDATTLFDVKMWVCVSINFDAKTMIANMLKSLKKQQVSDAEPLDSLQTSLKSEVMSKRFLLVMDDIWEDDETCWRHVLAPLSVGSLGSKILITTRIHSVASMFAKMIKQSSEKLSLGSLEEKELSKLFNTHVFAGVVYPDDELKYIAKQMVKKLLGCPVVAVFIGKIFNFHINKRLWRNEYLNTDIGNILTKKSSQSLWHILKLSYMHLPNYLQNCYSFCCIFPQDYEFDKDDIVRMWIALGYIHFSNIPGETLVDIGRKYFNILVQRSFFDEFRDYRGIVGYKMPNLLHALAQSVFAQECSRIVNDSAFYIPRTIRHLYIHSSNLEAAVKEIGEIKNLRSLFLSISDDAKYDEKVLHEILTASESIRLLVINCHKLQKIPETIGCLIHLRYLKTDRILGFELPRSISHLHHLQFIILTKHTFSSSKLCKISLPL